MPPSSNVQLPPPSPEHRRIAVGQFERANQVIATGNADYGIRLLLSCCKLDPGNLIYRQRLRLTEKNKYKNNLRGSRLAWLTTFPVRAKLKAAKRSHDYVKVLDCAEQVLARNPWDTSAQLDMAEAADALGLLDLAIWTLEQARQKNPRDAALNRPLARLYEKRGNFTQAIALWELVRRTNPADVEAQSKGKDLAANETIARGRYEDAVGGQAPPRSVLTQNQSQPEHPPSAEPGRELAGKAPAPPPMMKTHSPPGKGSSATYPALHDPVMPPADRNASETAKLRGRIEADPTNANAYLHLASVYRRAGQLEQAREVLQGGVGPTGNHFELMLELADLEIEPVRRNLVIAEEKIRLGSQDEDVRRVRLRLLKEINSRELELYRQKASRYPTEMGHRYELGVRLLRGGQVDEAIRELQAARSDARQQWRALLYLGYCFKTRNNWRLAQRNFEEALKSLPPNEEATRKEILFQLAQGSAESGDLATAVELAVELANMDFAYRDIGQLLDDWQTRLQQMKVASDK